MNTLLIALLAVPVLFSGLSVVASARRKGRWAVALAALAAGATLPLPALGWASRQAMMAEAPAPGIGAAALASFLAEAADRARALGAVGLCVAVATTLLFVVHAALALRAAAATRRRLAAGVAVALVLPLTALAASAHVATYADRVDDDLIAAFTAVPLACDDLADLLRVVPVARVEATVTDVRRRAHACVAEELARVDSPEALSLAKIRAELARTMGAAPVDASPLGQLATSPLLLDAGQRRAVAARLAHP